MKILCLYNNNIALELFTWLQEQGHEVILWSEKLDAEWCKDRQFDLAVSYTYRYILSDEILSALGYNAVNIHNALLPFNRGADPNLWSILDETPRGVTLHYMTSGLDQGAIIAQTLLAPVSAMETLESTYNDLDMVAKEMFKKAFVYYDKWESMRKEMCESGTYHKTADSKHIKDAIEQYGGYRIKIAELKEVFIGLVAQNPGGVLFKDRVAVSFDKYVFANDITFKRIKGMEVRIA